MANVKCKVNPCMGETVKDTSEVKSNGGSNLVETGNRRVGTMLNTGWKRHSRGREAICSRVRLWNCVPELDCEV